MTKEIEPCICGSLDHASHPSVDPSIKKVPRELEIYLDGLDALIDGRGWGIEHQEAIERIIMVLHCHDELIAACKAFIGPTQKLPFMKAVQMAKEAIAKAESL